MFSSEEPVFGSSFFSGKNLIFPLAFRRRVGYGFNSFQSDGKISIGPDFPAFFYTVDGVLWRI
jgi:hypothetical protein